MDEEATSVTGTSASSSVERQMPCDELAQGLGMLEQLLLAGEYRQLQSVLQALISTYEPYIPTADREVAAAK